MLIEKYNDKKLLCLTFDDGPSKYTNDLIEILNKYNINATFFVLGENIEKYTETLALEAQNNNLVCIHSYEHKSFSELSKTEILEQIDKTSSKIYSITNTTPKFIRVPYGITNSRIKTILKSKGLENVLWNVDSLDWELKNTDKVYNQVLAKTTGNDIILLHDIFNTSVQATEKIICYYKAKGYEFVTIEEFYRIKKIAKELK